MVEISTMNSWHWLALWVYELFYQINFIFVGCYPATISRQPKADQQNEDVSSNADKTTPGYGKIKDLPKVIWALLTNPTYMMINFGGAADGLTIAGLSAFLPKVMQSQYGFSAGIASALIGVLVIPAGGMFTKGEFF